MASIKQDRFSGKIDLTASGSEAAWPAPARARPGAPNVVIILLDDVGFGQLGCFGSPIRTPNLDHLALGGLRYSSMHATAMCSPTRACILTGRGPHRNHMGCVIDGTMGFPGYDGHIPRENGFISEILVAHGYNTYAVGKWHLTPEESLSAAGPYDSWPLGRGFERFYGFMDWGTSQYYPDLVYDNHRVAPDRGPQQGYHLTEDLVDHALSFIADAKQVDPNKPFFLYFCTGAMHDPLQVPGSWSEKYRGAFDEGWDAYRERVFARQIDLGIVPKATDLPPRDPVVPSWESLAEADRRVCARMMELYAGYLEHTDHHIGRLLEFLDQSGELNNTLVMAMSDNGASADAGVLGRVNARAPKGGLDDEADTERLGGPDSWTGYPLGWAWAGDTPFRRWKRETYRGGVNVPFIVHWPTGTDARGGIRGQFVRAIDILPTVLDAVGIDPPSSVKGSPQSPIDGCSFAASLGDEAARDTAVTQYFEMMGHRAIYRDGWRAVCPWPVRFDFAGAEMTADDLRALDSSGWELYHVDEDFAESHNLAEEEPQRLREMVMLWYVEAGRQGVLPLEGRWLRKLWPRPRTAEDRRRYTYHQGTQVVPEKAAVQVVNRAHRITADVDIVAGLADGVLVSHAGTGSFGGYSLFIQGGRLHYIHNYMGRQEFRISSERALDPGRTELRYEFEPSGPPDIPNGLGSPGRGSLFINGELVGSGDIPVTMPFLFGGGIEVGRDGESRPPVTASYASPFPFRGSIHSVTIDVGEPAADSPEVEAAVKLGLE